MAGLQVYSAEEKRALALYNFEEKASRETQLVLRHAFRCVYVPRCCDLKLSCKGV